MVEGHDEVRPQSFRQGNDRGVGSTERKIGVALHELSDPGPVLGERTLDVEALEAAEEASLGLSSTPALDEVGDFSHTEGRNHEMQVGLLEN